MNSSVWPIDGTLKGTITLNQSEPGSNGNKEVLYIPQSSSAGASPHPGHSQAWERGSYPSAEMQSVYSTAPTDQAF